MVVIGNIIVKVVPTPVLLETREICPTMTGHNPLRDGQPQPRAFPLGFGRKKRIKNIGQDILGIPGPLSVILAAKKLGSSWATEIWIRPPLGMTSRAFKRMFRKNLGQLEGQTRSGSQSFLTQIPAFAKMTVLGTLKGELKTLH